jgi:DoxX-like family
MRLLGPASEIRISFGMNAPRPPLLALGATTRHPVVNGGLAEHLFEPQQSAEIGRLVDQAAMQFLRCPHQKKVGQMSKISWSQVSAWGLALFFVVGSLSNVFAPGSIYEEYLRWGYPHWFHFVTGSLELTTAVLLAQARTRLWGSAVGCTVMLAALATVTLHGEYGHGVPPLIVATLSIVVGWIAWRKQLGMIVATGGRGNVCVRAFTGENLNIRVFRRRRFQSGPSNQGGFGDL